MGGASTTDARSLSTERKPVNRRAYAKPQLTKLGLLRTLTRFSF
jgi:hypothetical protein